MKGKYIKRKISEPEKTFTSIAFNKRGSLSTGSHDIGNKTCIDGQSVPFDTDVTMTNGFTRTASGMNQISKNFSGAQTESDQNSEKIAIYKKIYLCYFCGMRILPLVLVFFVIMFLFLVLPILTILKMKKVKILPKDPFEGISYEDIHFYKLAKNYTVVDQPLVPNKFFIDPDTPKKDMKWKSSNGETWVLVFSDEFNKDGRDFNPGKDPVW
ncbi:hypothetical protein BB559_007593 [Furculomyces boomerangus]|uniref:Uncharacterized protein n=3 Tax=Harpellales TaxID=61421 RepID=A0A2T9XWR9_9FUNG|nr:hypothetical protein BB559_007593 [Furculomyces boomerangus]